MTAPDAQTCRRTVVQTGGRAVTVTELRPLQIPQALRFLDAVQGGLAAAQGSFAAMAEAVFGAPDFLDFVLAECTDSGLSASDIGAGTAMRLLRAWWEVNADFFAETRQWIGTLLGGTPSESASSTRTGETA